MLGAPNGTGPKSWPDVGAENRAEIPTLPTPQEKWGARLHTPFYRTRRTEYNAAMPTYQEGDYVKVEFPDGVTGIGEWMWVRVRRCDEQSRTIYGVLDNSPINDYDGKLHLGSELAINFTRIREHRTAADFRSRN